MTSRRLLTAATAVFFTISLGSMATAAACAPDPQPSRPDPRPTPTTAAPTPTTAAPRTSECTPGMTLSIPFERYMGGHPEGYTSTLASMAVPSALQGKQATAYFRGENNGSVRPGTRLVVTSGSSKITLEDVEGAPGKVTTSTGKMTLSSSVDLSVVLGPEGKFSGKGSVVLTPECAPAPTTTTTAAPTTTTTAKPTTTTAAPVTSTTAAPVTTTTAKPTTTTVRPATCVDMASTSIKIDTSFGGAPGSSKDLVSKKIDASVVGKTAHIEFQGENNGSVRSGSNLVVTTGSSTVTLSDIEASAGKITKASGTVVLGSTLDIKAVLGAEGKFSGGGVVNISIECAPKVTTTLAPTTTKAPEVLGKVETPAPAPALAHTGINTIAMATAGLSFLLGGVSLLALARRVRTVEI